MIVSYKKANAKCWMCYMICCITSRYYSIVVLVFAEKYIMRLKFCFVNLKQ